MGRSFCISAVALFGEQRNCECSLHASASITLGGRKQTRSTACLSHSASSMRLCQSSRSLPAAAPKLPVQFLQLLQVLPFLQVLSFLQVLQLSANSAASPASPASLCGAIPVLVIIRRVSSTLSNVNGRNHVHDDKQCGNRPDSLWNM
jgi:hypothetical protein